MFPLIKKDHFITLNKMIPRPKIKTAKTMSDWYVLVYVMKKFQGKLLPSESEIYGDVTLAYILLSEYRQVYR